MSSDPASALEKKLGLRAGLRAYFVDLPPEVESVLHGRLGECVMVRDPDRSVDSVMVFASTVKSLTRGFDRWTGRLVTKGLIWAAWPKKSSGRESELDDRKVRDIGLAAGLVDVKVCSVSDTWSGLKFVRRLRDPRSSEVSHRVTKTVREQA